MVVRVSKDSVVLEVEDDGVGLAGTPGLGLTTTRERLEAIGGGLQVRSGRTGGTRFRAWVPATESGDGR
jgi:signal transduction histidine kinase